MHACVSRASLTRRRAGFLAGSLAGSDRSLAATPDVAVALLPPQVGAPAPARALRRVVYGKGDRAGKAQP